MKTSTELRKLMRACVDDERTLRHESKFVDARRAEALTRLAGERRQFVEDLEQLVDGAGQRPNGSWAELLSEAGRSLWVAAAGRNTADAITSCRQSRARTEALYDDAMQRPCSDETRRVLAAQHGRLHDETEELDRLRF